VGNETNNTQGLMSIEISSTNASHGRYFPAKGNTGKGSGDSTFLFSRSFRMVINQPAAHVEHLPVHNLYKSVASPLFVIRIVLENITLLGKETHCNDLIVCH